MIAPWGPNAALAQVILPRTVPVQQAAQFDIFPSQLAGMAWASIALDDTLLDPFVNPAKTTRVAGLSVFALPGAHAVTQGGGSGFSFPFGALAASETWAGGLVLSGQQLTHRPLGFPDPVRQTVGNHYASAVVARTLGDGFSIGVSSYWAHLQGLDGLDLLYPGSTRVSASGNQGDIRFGLLKQWPRRRALEVLLLYGRSDIDHDVEFPANSWDPTTRTIRVVPALEHNDDRLRFWGLHTAMNFPIDAEGGRVGWLFTANRLIHPTIPNYPLTELPRDPGRTYAFNVGGGVARALGRTTVAMDVIYEPIWSHTWGTTPVETETSSGATLPAGARTVDNRFRFDNVKIRGGFTHDFPFATDSTTAVRVQLGIAIRANEYRLHQRDFLAATDHHATSAWTEWGPSFGLGYRTRRLEIGYTGQITCGPQTCQLFGGSDDIVVAPDAGTGVIAPIGGGRQSYGQAITHRVTIILSRR